MTGQCRTALTRKGTGGTASRFRPVARRTKGSGAPPPAPHEHSRPHVFSSCRRGGRCRTPLCNHSLVNQQKPTPRQDPTTQLSGGCGRSPLLQSDSWRWAHVGRGAGGAVAGTVAHSTWGQETSPPSLAVRQGAAHAKPYLEAAPPATACGDSRPSATEGVRVQPAEGSDQERQARLPAPQPVGKRIARQAALGMTPYAPWGRLTPRSRAGRGWEGSRVAVCQRRRLRTMAVRLSTHSARRLIRIHALWSRVGLRGLMQAKITREGGLWWFGGTAAVVALVLAYVAHAVGADHVAGDGATTLLAGARRQLLRSLSLWLAQTRRTLAGGSARTMGTALDRALCDI